MASVEDAGEDSDDLLGGGGGNHFQDAEGANEGLGDFESSFPAIDTNEVRFSLHTVIQSMLIAITRLGGASPTLISCQTWILHFYSGNQLLAK
jgi:hypothetical protein